MIFVGVVSYVYLIVIAPTSEASLFKRTLNDKSRVRLFFFGFVKLMSSSTLQSFTWGSASIKKTTAYADHLSIICVSPPTTTVTNIILPKTKQWGWSEIVIALAVPGPPIVKPSARQLRNTLLLRYHHVYDVNTINQLANAKRLLLLLMLMLVFLRLFRKRPKTTVIAVLVPAISELLPLPALSTPTDAQAATH